LAMDTSLDGKYPLWGRTHCGDTDGTKQLQATHNVRSVPIDFGSALTLPAVQWDSTISADLQKRFSYELA